MNYIHHRKLLRLSTFVAVTIGLAIGSSAMAEPTTSTSDTGELANGGQEQEQTQTEPQQEPQQQEQAQQQEDLPGDIQDFVDFVEERQQEGIDDIYEYTYDGAQNMADAMTELVPDDHVNADQLESDISSWKDRLDVLDTERPDFATLTNLLFTEGAQHLSSVQEALAPGQSQVVQQVQQGAEGIQPDANIEGQQEQVHSYFISATQAVQEIYMSSQQEEPVTLAPTVDLIEASTPTQMAQDQQPPHQQQPQQQDQQQQEDDDGLFGLGDGVPGEVDNFEEFVQDHRTEGVDHVANYTRDGTQHFHDAMEALVEDQDQELVMGQLERFQESVTALDETPRFQYPDRLEQILIEGTQILATIQQAYYPQYEQEVQQVFTTIEQFDTNRAIEEQVNAIQNVFIQASATTRLMAEAEQQPQALTQVQHESGEPGQYGDEPPRQEEGQQPGQQPEEEGEVGAGPPVTGEVQQYIEFVETLQLRDLTTDGDQKVVEGLRNLEGALSFFIEEQGQQQPGQQEPGMEQPGEVEEIQMQELGQEQEPEMEEPGMEDPGMQAQNIEQQHQELTDQINEMEQAAGTPVFSEYLADTTEAAAALLTSIQEEQFPQLQQDVQGLTQIVEQINAQDNVEEQAAQILAFFAYTGQTLQMMEEQQVTEEPAALLMSLF